MVGGKLYNFFMMMIIMIDGDEGNTSVEGGVVVGGDFGDVSCLLSRFCLSSYSLSSSS